MTAAMLHWADNALIMGQRYAEQIAQGPTLEEDIAISNTGLDYLGQATAIYELIAPHLGQTSDQLAFRRSERQYTNFLICELPLRHFGDLIVKQLWFSAYQIQLWTVLAKTESPVQGIAEKSLKEAQYHWKHACLWLNRLGDGTELSRSRVQDSLDFMGDFTGELTAYWPFYVDFPGLGNPDLVMRSLHDPVISRIRNAVSGANLIYPAGPSFQSGGPLGNHTEHLGHLLSELQYLQRTYPSIQW